MANLSKLAFTSADALACRGELVSSLEGKCFDYFWAFYKLGRIGESDERLNVHQHNRLLVVKRLADYYNSSLAKAFEEDVQKNGVISVDTESYLPPPSKVKSDRGDLSWKDKKRVVIIHFGSPAGIVILFDVEAICKGPLDQSRPMDALPEIFSHYMREESIYKLGSDIELTVEEDLGGFRAKNLIDTREIFQNYSVRGGKDGAPLIDFTVDVGNRCGLGEVSLWVKGQNFKPMPENTYENRYGAHCYKEKGIKKWPNWRGLFCLFSWKKDYRGNFKLPALFYVFHDALSPLALIAGIYLQSFKVHGVPLAISIPEVYRKVLEPYRRDYRADWGMEAVQESDVLSQGTSAKGSMASKKSMSTKRAATPPRLSSSRQAHQATGDDSSEDSGSGATSSDSEESDSGSSSSSSSESEEENRGKRGGKRSAPTKGSAEYRKAKHRKLDEKRKRRAEMSAFKKWNSKRARMNPYKNEPSFGRRCLRCGQGGHSEYSRTGVRMCPRNDEDVACEYYHCQDRNAHRTQVCPFLHYLCPRCLHRGHREQDGCNTWSAEEWEERRNRFEEVAELGRFTRNRSQNERWGFFGARPYTQYPYPMTYGCYRRMTVATADYALANQRPNVEVNAPHSRQAEERSGPSRRPSSPRPPSPPAVPPPPPTRMPRRDTPREIAPVEEASSVNRHARGPALAENNPWGEGTSSGRTRRRHTSSPEVLMVKLRGKKMKLKKRRRDRRD